VFRAHPTGVAPEIGFREFRWWTKNIQLASEFVDHSQEMTVAARATAEKKAVAQRS